MRFHPFNWSVVATMMMLVGYNRNLVRAFSFTRERLPVRNLSALKATQKAESNGGGKPETSLPPVPKNSHRIVLMRHGESEFNNANIFTGWCDVALTPRGRVEASEAGEVFRSQDMTFRQCYCSMLTRAIVTAQRALEAGGVSYTPISYDWRLNERHYGKGVLVKWNVVYGSGRCLRIRQGDFNCFLSAFTRSPAGSVQRANGRSAGTRNRHGMEAKLLRSTSRNDGGPSPL